MKKILFLFSALFLISNPAWAKNWDAFNGDYIAVYNISPKMAADPIVESLNLMLKQYPTVEKLLDYMIESLDSGELQSSLLTSNLKYSLQYAQEIGFGTGKFERWRWKFVKGVCGKQEVVYYVTVKHPAKNYSFGFYLSAGPGVINDGNLKRNTTGEECH